MACHGYKIRINQKTTIIATYFTMALRLDDNYCRIIIIINIIIKNAED